MPDFSCYIIGDDSLLIYCGDSLLQKKHKILGVCSTNSSVQSWCVKNNINIITFNNFEKCMQEKTCDYLFSISNKKILGKKILNLPKKGAINYHNALPNYGGVYATTLAILDDKKTHGVMWHLMTEKVDEGEILLQSEISIEKNDTAGSLNVKCHEEAKKLFDKLITKLEKDEILCLQSNVNKNYYSFLKVLARIRNGAIVDWKCNGEKIERFYRALSTIVSSSPNEIDILKIVVNDKLTVVPTSMRLYNGKNSAKPGVIIKIDPSNQEIVVTTSTLPVVITGLKTIDGYLYKVENIINEKGVISLGNSKYQLPPFPEELGKKLELFTKEHFKDEKWWIEQLYNVNPAGLPQLVPLNTIVQNKNKENSEIFAVSYQVESNVLSQASEVFKGKNMEQVLFVHILAYLYRVNGYDAFSINFSNQDIRKSIEGLEQFFSPYVPFNISIEDIDKLNFLSFAEKVDVILQSLCKHASYKRDVFHRYPILHPRLFMQLGIFLCNVFESLDVFAGAAETALVIHISGEKITFVFDQKKLPYFTTSELQEISQEVFNQVQTLLCNGLQNKDTPLVGLPILDEKNQNKLLKQLQGEELKPAQYQSLIKGFENNVKQTPENIGVVYKTRLMTYFELNVKANLLANYLKTVKKIKQNDVVAVCFEPSVYYIVCILAIMKVGATYLPIEPSANFPSEQVEIILNEAKPKLIITDSKLSLTRFIKYSSRDILQIDNLEEKNEINNPQKKKKKTKNINEQYAPDNTAYIIYTSGSTGHPKGVPISNTVFYNSMLGRFQYYEKVLKESGVDKVNLLLLLSTAFDTSMAAIFWALLQKGKLVLLPLLKNKNPKKILSAIKKYDIKVIICVPSLYRKILEYAAITKSNKPSLEGVKLVIIGGDVYQNDLIEMHKKMLPNVPFYDEYGTTEGGVCSTSGRIDQNFYSAGYLGSPIPGTYLLVLDKYNKVLPPGVSGELGIGGNISQGYINKEKLNKEKFISFNEKNIYKTGDLCVSTKTGGLFFKGRIDYQIKFKGMRIGLEQIEKNILEFSCVKQCVVATKEINKESYLVAYLVFSDNKETEKRIILLRMFLLKKLPDYMIPVYFVPLDQLPLTRNNKINRNALPIPETKPRYTTQIYEAPKTLTEKGLANIWAEILRITNIGLGENVGVGINDNFFENGGDSLHITKLMLRVKDYYGVDLSFSNFLADPTIKNLANMIDNKPCLENKQLILEIGKDIILPKNIQSCLVSQTKSIELTKKNIFLTGSTGFLGSHILFDLIKSGAKVYCLIRSSNEQQAKIKLKKILENYKIRLNLEALFKEEKMVIVVGDLNKPNFGMDDFDYNKLAEDVGVVIHCGARVNHILDYNALRETNVNGTKRVLEFAAINSKRLYYISTLSAVSPGDELQSQNKTTTEQPVVCNESIPDGGYAQTKFVSEILLNQAKQKMQMDITIFRVCCWVLGSSEFGITPIEQNHLLSLVSGCVQIKSAPNWDINVNILPVDIVSESIVKITQQPVKNIKPLYNIYNKCQVNWLDLIKWIKEKHGCNVPIVKQEEWYKFLQNIDANNPLYLLLPHYTSGSASNPIKEDITKVSENVETCENNVFYSSKEALEKYFGYLFSERSTASPRFFYINENTITEKSKTEKLSMGVSIWGQKPPYTDIKIITYPNN